MIKRAEKICKELGRVICRRRKSKSWSQEKLAEEAKIDANHISRLERGVTNPRLTTLIQLAYALECTLADLFEFTGSSPYQPTPELLFEELKKSLKNNPKLQAKIISELAEELKTKI